MYAFIIICIVVSALLNQGLGESQEVILARSTDGAETSVNEVIRLIRKQGW